RLLPRSSHVPRRSDGIESGVNWTRCGLGSRSSCKAQDPIALSDHQLRIAMQAAGPLAVEKRGVLLERIGVQLRLRGIRRPTDPDVELAVINTTVSNVEQNSHRLGHNG